MRKPDKGRTGKDNKCRAAHVPAAAVQRKVKGRGRDKAKVRDRVKVKVRGRDKAKEVDKVRDRVKGRVKAKGKVGKVGKVGRAAAAAVKAVRAVCSPAAQVVKASKV